MVPIAQEFDSYSSSARCSASAMGAEWPPGASLAMESWLVRARGFMSRLMQGSWGIGFAMSALIFAVLNDSIGWRGMLWIGILSPETKGHVFTSDLVVT